MFAVLTVQKRMAHGVLGRLRLFSRPAPPASHMVQEGNISYLSICAQMDKRHPLDWMAITRLAAWAPAGLLLPDSFSPPDDCSYRPVDDSPFQRLLCCRACHRSLQEADLSPSKLQICLVDHSGQFGKVALSLVRYASTVKVYTPQPDLFEEIAQQSIKQYGAPLVVSDDPGCVSGCPVVLNPWGMSAPVSKEAVVFSTRPLKGLHSLCLSEYTAAVGGEAGRLCPGGIDPTQFAAALYASGRLRDPVEVSSCLSGDERLDFLSVASFIRRAYDALNAKETDEFRRKH
ncbi:hypothetical protein NIF40_06765 [[Clostridium] leptum]|nr:hypothetical protein [[Clostridium] leptum]